MPREGTLAEAYLIVLLQACTVHARGLFNGSCVSCMHAVLSLE